MRSQPLGGLQPLAQMPLGSVTLDPEATAEERLGDPADPRHGLGLIAPLTETGYPWEVLAGVVGPKGPYGNEAQLVGQADGWPAPAGHPGQDPMYDYTPDTHAAPWPKGVEQDVGPDATARQLEASQAIHSADTGASVAMRTTIGALQDRWEEINTVTPGSSIQDPGMSGQQKAASGGFGTTDRVSSFAHQNSFGFDSAHAHRRFATGSIPGN